MHVGTAFLKGALFCPTELLQKCPRKSFSVPEEDKLDNKYWEKL